MKRLVFSALAICLGFSFVQAGQDYANGVNARNKGDMVSAIQFFHASCFNKNNDLACYEAGKIYEFGFGGKVKKDQSLAQQAYQKCCDKTGRSDCCSKVGKDSGGGQVQEGSDFSRYVTACEGGDSVACNKAYKISKEKFFAQKSCDLGDLNGCSDLASFYYGANDYKKSFELWEQGCKKNHGLSCRNLAYSYREGKGVSQNVEKAIKVLEPLCEGERPQDCLVLGIIYKDDQYGKKDILKAYNFISKACASGKSKDACKVINSPEFMAAACDGGSGEACRNLGFAYAAQKDPKAVEYFEKSCEYKLAAGCTGLGFLYLKGGLIEKNEAEAKKYFKLGCDLGNKTGCDELANF
ncbi:SEL1-like repeat protein [Campylobacter sp. RM15925]|uniref:tetratricopeptide repeat protein n=1 Tax=Campylobacter sp. RM15925 TaxID=1705724 RepID=UPI001474558C|nr:SEL1-like repeat protein [Campylobacter sp. RM15925]